MKVHRVSELWGLMYELGNRVGESWRPIYELEKQTEKPSIPACAYKASGEPNFYPVCRQPAEYCETQPASTGTYELRLYWLSRQHAALEHAEEEWWESISDLLEWERALEEARNAKTKEEIIALLEGKRDEMRTLCNEFAAYADSLKYTGKGKHPLE